MKNRVQRMWRCIKKDVCSIVQAYPVECVVMALGVIFMSIIFRYGDGLSITAWSVEIWDAIASGRLSDFTAVTTENLRGAPHGACGAIIQLLPWAIWNFPIWLTHPLNGSAYIFSSICVLWSKLFLIGCAFLGGLLCYRIINHVNGNNKHGKAAAVLCWGSGTLVMSIGYFMQDEILYILTFLGAIYCTFYGKQMWSLICVIATVTFAPFMLPPCLLLIIYQTRKVIVIFGQAMLTLLPSIVQQTIIEQPPSIENGVFLEWFFGRALLPGGNGSYSIFAVVTLVVVINQYFIKRKNETEKQRFLLHSIACMMTAMCMFSWLHAYRFFICVPFLILCIFTTENTSKYVAGMVGLCVFEWCRFLIACYGEDYVFTSNVLVQRVQNIFKLQGNSYSFYTLLKKYLPFLEGKEVLVTSVAFVFALWLLWLTYPKQEYEIDCKIPHRIILCIYTLCPLMFTLLFCGMLLKVDSLKVPIMPEGILAPAITGENSLEEYYKARTPTNRAEVSIRTVTWNKDYPDGQTLCMDIVDADTGAVVETEVVPVNQLPDNQYYMFSFNNARLKSGCWYIFRLYSPEVIESDQNYIYLLRSDGGTADLERHYGVIVENNNDTTICTKTDYDFISEILTY